MPWTRAKLNAVGVPGELELETAPDLPYPASDEVRLRVLVTSAAFTDVMICKGLYPDVTDKPPFTPGYDMVGVVDAVGAGATRFRPGDRVADLTTIGAYAEYIFLPIWGMRAYTVREKINIWRGKLWSRPFFWEQLLRDDLSSRLTEFDLPIYFLVGRHDQTANPELSRAYFDAIEAPVKGFYVFENSAHSPLFDEPEKATGILLQDVVQGRNGQADEG